MGIKRLFPLIFLFLIYTKFCNADCINFFKNSTYIRINDNSTFEKGTLVADYSTGVGSNTLMFTSQECYRVFEINGSRLFLKENLLDQSVCDIKDMTCGWKCNTAISLSNTLFVVIERISRGILEFRNSSYEIFVPESASIETKLISFRAQDLKREDCVSMQNIFFLSIDESFFHSRLDNGIYSIFLKSKLDYDQPINRFNLTVTVIDAGDGLQNSTILNIQVTDVDDMDPEFDHNEYYLNITEENTNIVNVTTTPPINATDRDKGGGRQEVYYRFDNDKNSKDCFTIDKISGKISLTCTLDRENTTDYKLTIKAVQRNTESRSCTATLLVKVLDINDNIPVFNPTEYRANITEHSRMGTTVVRLHATDLDENPLTRYVILSPYNDTFSARDNGDVIVQNPSKIDRETGNGTVIIKVKALDGESGLYSSSTATVHIVLLDVNDKEPVFQKPEYVFPLPAEPSEGFEIGEVKAIDDDQVNTPNSDVRYKLQPTMFSNLFAIHNKTGKITVQKKAPTSAGVIELVALAQDRGIPPLRTSVHILLSRTVVIGKTVNFTVPRSMEEVKSQKENIQSGIGRILNLTVSVEKIEEVVNHRSMCYLNVTAKYHNNSDVPGDVLQSIILQHMSDILALFSNPNSYKLEASQETFTPTVIALIVISVLMFIGIIVLIGYIHSTTKKFKRHQQLHQHLTRQSSLYESQELKIEMPDEQTSDYNGSINGSHSLRNSTTGDLKEGVVSAFTNPAFITDETEIKLTAAEEEAEQSLNDLTNRLEAEENKVMIVDSYNPSESDIELDPINGYENTPAKFAEATPKDYENVPHTFKSADLPEDYPSNDQNEADSENNTNENMDDDEEPNPDYEVKAVRFSAQVLDTEENKFEPLREKEDKTDLRKDEESGEDLDEEENNVESGDHVNEDLEEDKEDDFGDGIENERTDEEILSPNEVLQEEKSENEENIPHFSFDTKM
ncbi:protocadherin gamma-B4 [Magallana gigas]|uniref:protocadherin gamma-B4 n=1 Tax=Magallana gigas TaxID=29159 RepID=UPI003341E27D